MVVVWVLTVGRVTVEKADFQMSVWANRELAEQAAAGELIRLTGDEEVARTMERQAWIVHPKRDGSWYKRVKLVTMGLAREVVRGSENEGQDTTLRASQSRR